MTGFDAFVKLKMAFCANFVCFIELMLRTSEAIE